MEDKPYFEESGLVFKVGDLVRVTASLVDAKGDILAGTLGVIVDIIREIPSGHPTGQSFEVVVRLSNGIQASFWMGNFLEKVIYD